jgi:hypothetical protein
MYDDAGIEDVDPCENTKEARGQLEIACESSGGSPPSCEDLGPSTVRMIGHLLEKLV